MLCGHILTLARALVAIFWLKEVCWPRETHYLLPHKNKLCGVEKLAPITLLYFLILILDFSYAYHQINKSQVLQICPSNQNVFLTVWISWCCWFICLFSVCLRALAAEQIGPQEQGRVTVLFMMVVLAQSCFKSSRFTHLSYMFIFTVKLDPMFLRVPKVTTCPCLHVEVFVVT